MSFCPGLCGEFAAVPYRVFLGTLPALALEARFLRQLQSVYPWYVSRKRVKEQANEFIEIDLASCDPELMLRYCHVYYVRREMFDELVDKQLTLIETGKAPKLADVNLVQCLTECNSHIAQRHHLEVGQLGRAKNACNVSGRRELNPHSILDPYDLLTMMRVVEEDSVNVLDAEMKARAFLPRDHVEGKVKNLTTLLMGSDAKSGLDKKEQKLLSRMIPVDYAKIGCVDKYRPADVTTYMRFVGERISKTPAENYFKRALWGNVFRKYATNPHFLSSISLYWAKYSNMDASPSSLSMPQPLVEAVCAQQKVLPATKFRAQYLYTSADSARQLWKTDMSIPLMRLYPLLGAHAAEDLAASILTDAFWASAQIDHGKSPLEENVVRAVRQFVDDTAALYENNQDGVLKMVDEGCRSIIPPPTQEELQEATAAAETSDQQQQQHLQEAAEASA